MCGAPLLGQHHLGEGTPAADTSGGRWEGSGKREEAGGRERGAGRAPCEEDGEALPGPVPPPTKLNTCHLTDSLTFTHPYIFTHTSSHTHSRSHIHMPSHTGTHTHDHTRAHSRAEPLADLIDAADVLRVFLQQQHVCRGRGEVMGVPPPSPAPGSRAASSSTPVRQASAVAAALDPPLPRPGPHPQTDASQRGHRIHASTSQAYSCHPTPPHPAP